MSSQYAVAAFCDPLSLWGASVNGIESRIASAGKRVGEVDESTNYQLTQLSNATGGSTNDSNGLRQAGSRSRNLASESMLKLTDVERESEEARNKVAAGQGNLRDQYERNLASEGGPKLTDTEKAELAAHHSDLQEKYASQSAQLDRIEEGRKNASAKATILADGSQQAVATGVASASPKSAK